jgi:hypothetical protein
MIASVPAESTWNGSVPQRGSVGSDSRETVSETFIPIDPTLPRCGTDRVQQGLITFRQSSH